MSYDDEFLGYVSDILNSEEFVKRKEYLHHPNKSVYQHSLEVAYASYKFAKKHNLNARRVNKRFTLKGDECIIDGKKEKYEYVPLCGKCYMKKVLKIK